MPPSSRKGLFITVEGIDGCGKTTVMELIHSSLLGKGCSGEITFVGTFTNSAYGAQVRETLVDSKNVMSDTAYSFMMLSLHLYNYEKFIKPVVNSGRIAIIDRSILSTLAFQLHGVDAIKDTHVRELWQSMPHLVPDLSLILSIDPRLARQRRDARDNKSASDRIESQDDIKHYQYASTYNELGKKLGDKAHVIDNNGSIHNLLSGVEEAVEKILNIHYKGVK